MVVPLQQPELLGPPPPGVAKALHGIRWCVLAMYACVGLRMAQGDALIPVLSDVLPAVAGTYLLRDDLYFVQCHRCLQSVSAVAQGGLTCLPSFMVLSGMTGTLGFFRALSISVISDRQSTSDLLPVMVFVSSVVHLAAFAVCCVAWKALHRNRTGLLDEDHTADVEAGQFNMTSTATWQQMGEDDPALRAAILASMGGETRGPSGAGEEDTLLMAAIQRSQAAAMSGGVADPEAERMLQQSESHETRRIVQEQDAEFEESLAMDQIREMAERQAREDARVEEQRVREEETRLQADEAEKQGLEEARVAAALKAVEEKRARLPAEVAAGEPGRVLLLFRLPSGQRRQRAFRASDFVSSLYDFVEVEDPDMAENPYCLVTQVPRRVYNDKAQTLEVAGVENQCVILAEVE